MAVKEVRLRRERDCRMGKRSDDWITDSSKCQSHWVGLLNWSIAADYWNFYT
jgi:hypothetical protein